jgi:hypothetical protein
MQPVVHRGRGVGQSGQGVDALPGGGGTETVSLTSG